MRATLIPFPDETQVYPEAISVEFEREGGLLWMRFIIDDNPDFIAWPGEAPVGRADELWKHTCFEAFVTTDDGYREFNLSPSGQWASYRFDGYREGMADAVEVADVAQLDLAEDMLALEADLDLPSPLSRIALSAVIESLDGRMTYWALAHPSDKPDFHHPDSFVLDLP